MTFNALEKNALQQQIQENAKARDLEPKPLKVLLEVEITDPEWLGLDDYKEHPDINTNLDVFNEFAKEEGGALGALVNIIDNETPARFVAVLNAEEDLHLCCVDGVSGFIEKVENQQQAMFMASESLDQIYNHLSENHSSQHIKHFVDMAKAHLNQIEGGDDPKI